jgi:hypothetical protein
MAKIQFLVIGSANHGKQSVELFVCYTMANSPAIYRRPRDARNTAEGWRAIGN